MTIDRAFSVTFVLAVILEVIRFPFGALPVVVETIVSGLGYGLLLLLGFMLGRGNFGYAAAFVRTLPFVLLWFLVGILNLVSWRSETGSVWSTHDQEQAVWGYVLATVMLLPVAFGASALGVWLGRIWGGRRSSTNAA